MVVEAIPLAAHDWEVILEFLLINDDSLLLLPFKSLDGRLRTIVVGGHHLCGVP